MLTYQEELELSDALVLRRSALQSEKAGESLDDDQRDQIEAGNKAAQELVEAYLPFIYTIAHRCFRSANLQYGGTIEYNDLVNEGVKAAISCTSAFNARGKNGRPGVRFSTYSERMIHKSIRRFIAGESTPITAAVNKIMLAQQWYANSARLQIELGRKPTDDEVESEMGGYTREDIADTPPRKSFVDLDDAELNVDVEYQGPLNSIMDDQFYGRVFSLALNNIGLNDRLINVAYTYFGCDRGYPRSPEETAQDVDLGIRETARTIQLVQDILIHPHYRTLLAREISQISESNTSEETTEAS